MKLLSIDVGIKNLAYCLFDFNNATKKYEILLWDVINLCGEPPHCSTPECKKIAKFSVADTYFCPTHAKKSPYIAPTANISLKKIKKMKLAELHQVVKNYQIQLETTAIKKDEVLKTVINFMEKKMLQSVIATGANDFDLIKLGIAMRDAFQKDLVNHLSTLDQIIIENQISPIANRMKTLQGMIAQFFIMHNKTKISFISSANKLKVEGIPPPAPQATPLLSEEICSEGGGVEPSEACGAGGAGGGIPPGVKPPDYAARKKEGIRITLALITDNHIQWLPHFKQHKKKDDLADSFLQGKWFLQKLI
jgi:hypothetical protein